MKLRDYQPNDIKHRNLAVLTSALRLGLVSQRGSSRGPMRSPAQLLKDLPIHLCQEEVTRQRLLFIAGSNAWLRKRHVAGERVFFVTVINPNFGTTSGALTPEHFVKFRDWVQRRARRLINHGFYLGLGVVDISYNEEGAVGGTDYWEPHAHLIITVKAKPPYDVGELLRDIFRPKARPPYWGFKSVVVKTIPTVADLRKVREYISSKLLAECQQRRCSYLDEEGNRNTRKFPLRSAQQDELNAVVNQIGPRARWILLGLRRDGDRISRVIQSSKRKRHRKYTYKKMY